MVRHEIWEVTIHYFPRATNAGVHPVEASFVQVLVDEEREAHPEYYVPHSFLFDKAPSRADFVNFVKLLPWTSVWEKSLFPALTLSAWPMVDWMHKAGSADIIDDQGRVVGRVDISRDYVFFNPGINRQLAVTCDLCDQAVRHLPKNRRKAARDLISKHEHQIKERAFLAIDQESDLLPDCDDLILHEINALLFQYGFRKNPEKTLMRFVS